MRNSKAKFETQTTAITEDQYFVQCMNLSLGHTKRWPFLLTPQFWGPIENSKIGQGKIIYSGQRTILFQTHSNTTTAYF